MIDINRVKGFFKKELRQEIPQKDNIETNFDITDVCVRGRKELARVEEIYTIKVPHFIE